MKSLGQINYEAWVAAYVPLRNSEVPDWNNFTEETQAPWEAGAQAVKEAVKLFNE